MSIEKMKDKPHGKLRKLPYRYRDRANGFVRYFKTRKEAEEYQEETNSQKRRTGLGLPSTVADLRKYTVCEIIHSYMHNRPPEQDELDERDEQDSELPENVFLVLHKFSCRDICSKTLFEFNAVVAEQYKDSRLKETVRPPGSNGDPKPISPRTVRWEISRIQLAWKAAKKWPGLSHLKNPWEGLRVKGSTGGRRERSLEEGELEALIESTESCLIPNRYYVPLAINLAVDTGLRRQEIFNLTWEDVSFKKRRIKIRKSKTDAATGNGPVDIVLPVTSEFRLRQLQFSLQHDGRLPGPDSVSVSKGGSLPTGKIFPMTGKAFKQSFGDVVRRAKIEDLTFHDLRRTANTNFIKATLSLEERNIMMRHADKSTNAIYQGRNVLLNLIQDKLDRHFLNGKTRKEAELELDKSVKATFLKLLDRGLQEGLTLVEAHERATNIQATLLGIGRHKKVRPTEVLASTGKGGA